MEKRKINKLKVGIVIILILIIIFLDAKFIMQNKKIAEDEENKETSSNLKIDDIENDDKEKNESDINKDYIVEEKENEEIKTPNAQQLDINSDEVKKLYNYILKNSDYQELTVYQTKKVTVEDMNNKLKLMTIFLNLEDKSLDETTHEFYSKEVVEEKAREIFGQNVEIHHESCSIVFGEEIDFKDGQYDRYRTKREGRTQWEFSKNVIISAEKKDDELNIYDKYIHIYSDQERGGETFYSASDKKEEIMEDEVKTFKHNFKKNSDGSYYWVSTEPIQ